MATKMSKNIIWTVDPFGDLSASAGQSAKVAEMVAKKTGSEIEPLYVLSPDGFNWAGDFSNQWVKQVKPKVLDKIGKKIAQTGIKALPPTIIVHKMLSLTGDTKKVIGYAKRTGAKMIVLSTHARKGLNRFVLGSFAETAILNSKVPLLIVNPKCQLPKSFNKALFATDLSKSSKRGFRKFLKNTKGLVNTVVIYHKMPDPIEPVVQTGVQMAGGGWVSVQQFLSKESKKCKAECDKLAKVARDLGFNTQVVIDKSPGFVTEAMLDQAHASKVGMIAMVSKTGPVASVLIGSVGRQMARVSDIPVYLFHEEA